MKFAMIRSRRCVVAVATIAAAVAWPAVGFAEERWKPLFNGRDLSGWYTYIQGEGRDKDPSKLIQVVDGVVHGYKDADAGSEQPHGYICTLDEYSNYRLRFKYKWGVKRFAPRADTVRDAGLLFHVVGRDGRAFGVWPMSVECQVQEHDTGDLIAVDTRCTSWVVAPAEGEKYPTFREPTDGGQEITNTWYINASKVCDRVEGWNDVEVEVRGAKSAIYKVNGQVNQRLANIEQPDGKSWKPLERGRIAFQIESAEVMYRDIEILPL